MLEFINSYFSKQGVKFCKQLQNNISAIMQCGKANTYSISRQLSKMNNKAFKTNEIALYRFLQMKDFQIDDSFWRCHINLIFDAFKENKIVELGDKIQVNIDFTTHEDNFLILSASVLLNDKAITIYFTSRKYPKKQGQMSQKKMEEAFIKGLRHVLSKKYDYVIVADRGFGNQRFASLCKENGFEYVLRIRENLIVELDEETINLKSKESDEKFDALVKHWKEIHHFTISKRAGEIWYLLSDNPQNDACGYYKKRFKIEKNYQDCKSSGYEIEKNKIRKYDRFKRMMYLVVLSHALTCIIGHIINFTESCIKKNSCLAIDKLNIKLVLAFSGLDMKHFYCTIPNPLVSSGDFSLTN